MKPRPQSSFGQLILVVDDVEDNRELYQTYLAYVGFEVLTAADGSGAVACAVEHRPDLVVMDLSLPVLDGWEATRRLKADPRTSSIPIIALTAHLLTGAEHMARDAGAQEFLVKPCRPDDLVRVIRETLRRDEEFVPEASSVTRIRARAPLSDSTANKPAERGESRSR